MWLLFWLNVCERGSSYTARYCHGGQGAFHMEWGGGVGVEEMTTEPEPRGHKGDRG